MAAGIVRVGLVALASIGTAAYGQNNVTLDPSTGTLIHPGAAILDVMGIFAGAPAEAGPRVHPGTVILDSMGIFAGRPVPDAPNSNTVRVTEVIPQ